MDTNANLNATAPLPAAPTTKAKPGHKASIRFPYQSHCAITPAMKAAIERAARRMCLNESNVHRMALIHYLTQVDPEFARENGNA